MDLPLEQQAIRAKCFHPSGPFVEFPLEDVALSIPARFEKIAAHYAHRETDSPGLSFESVRSNCSMLTTLQFRSAHCSANERFSPSAISRLACESCKRKALRSLGKDGSRTRQILPAFSTPMMATNSGSSSCSISKATVSWAVPRH